MEERLPYKQETCEFESRHAYHTGGVAQILVEHHTENVGVTGSIPVSATMAV